MDGHSGSSEPHILILAQVFTPATLLFYQWLGWFFAKGSNPGDNDKSHHPLQVQIISPHIQQPLHQLTIKSISMVELDSLKKQEILSVTNQIIDSLSVALLEFSCAAGVVLYSAKLGVMLASEEKLFSDSLDGDEVSTCLLTSGSVRLPSSDELSTVLGDSAFL